MTFLFIKLITCLSKIASYLQLMHTTTRTRNFWNQKILRIGMLDRLLPQPSLLVIGYSLQMSGIPELLYAEVVMVRHWNFDLFWSFCSEEGYSSDLSCRYHKVGFQSGEFFPDLHLSFFFYSASFSLRNALKSIVSPMC